MWLLGAGAPVAKHLHHQTAALKQGLRVGERSNADGAAQVVAGVVGESDLLRGADLAGWRGEGRGREGIVMAWEAI